jgi:hypothetical protein
MTRATRNFGERLSASFGKTNSQETINDYADQKEDVEGSAQKTQIYFKLHGRYLIVKDLDKPEWMEADQICF